MAQSELKNIMVTTGNDLKPSKGLVIGSGTGIGSASQEIQHFQASVKGKFTFELDASALNSLRKPGVSNENLHLLAMSWQRQNTRKIAALPVELDREIAEKLSSLTPPATESERLQQQQEIIKQLIETKVPRIESRINSSKRLQDMQYLRAALDIKLLTASVDELNEKLYAVQLRAQAEQQRLEDEQKLAAQQAAENEARQQAENEARQQENIQATSGTAHRLPAALAAARPMVLDATRLYPIIAGGSEAFVASLRSAAGWAASAAAGTGSGLMLGVTALLYPSKLEAPTLTAKPVVTSFPLELLAPELAQRLTEAREAVEAQRAAEVPLRLTAAAIGEDSDKVALAAFKPTATVPATVKVVHATHDPATGNYTAQTAEQPPRTLLWTPAVNPPDPSTALPAETVEPEAYEGPAVEPVELQVLELPVAEPVEIDDLIIIFPVDSGMAPIYVMYVSPRYLPGVVTGHGLEAGPGWMAAAVDEGARIPLQIEELLLGKTYSSFDTFRQAIWRTDS
ncbi:S-type pyocin domain-containing protein [Pseudomonas sp. KNUC1026]|uniref:S-type pyocin domain-containing protein n=1 Tax=Pseudomonas sp. KNUC1026 TaxID=2893890 RepID=UPI001F3273A0|nr:S-type pyocin domain-containing protein [Pseudomonas sp. KNUC1026]UFH48830.1 S-type pyocin domain-containing protein [Pseudomonas sp. KNUC1026]